MQGQDVEHCKNGMLSIPWTCLGETQRYTRNWYSIQTRSHQLHTDTRCYIGTQCYTCCHNKNGRVCSAYHFEKPNVVRRTK